MTAAPATALFDPRTAALTAALVYLVMPLTVWTILHGRHDRRSTELWCLGGLALGLASTLVGLRGLLPDWTLAAVAHPLSYLAYPLRCAALRRERGLHLSRPTALGPLALVAVGLALLPGGDGPRIAYGLGAHALGSLWLAAEARAVARHSSSRSARLVAGFSLLLAALLLLRLLLVVLVDPMGRHGPGGIEVVVTLVGGLLAGVYGNLGFIGIAYEASRARELEQVRLLTRAQAAHEHTLRHSQALRELLREREDMLQLLAHEVRQPLHNASAALQGAAAELGAGPAAAPGAQGIDRARRVLADIAGTVDNTLASTALLSGAQQVTLQDTDIDTLVALAIADLPPAAQQRVQVERQSRTRTAAMDGSLMRLALRNLLANAARYAPPPSPVTLSIADSDEPLALVIEVGDQGPGIEPSLHDRLFDIGARGSHGQAGHGLGLHIVHRVMQRHGGNVQWRARAGGGTVFRLVIPQDRDG